MSDTPARPTPDIPVRARPGSSRQRYGQFVDDYKLGRVDEATEAADKKPKPDAPKDDRKKKAKRRAYFREYLRWLWPYRFGVGFLFFLALMRAGMEMIEPLFMRRIIDGVLLNTTLDTPARFSRLNVTGLLFVALIVSSNLIGVLRDYRQRLLNAKVMLSLRRSLFERLLYLPLPKLWDMKTGGILSRLSGDVDTTTGLLQMAIVSP